MIEGNVSMENIELNQACCIIPLKWSVNSKLLLKRASQLLNQQTGNLMAKFFRPAMINVAKKQIASQMKSNMDRH